MEQLLKIRKSAAMIRMPWNQLFSGAILAIIVSLLYAGIFYGEEASVSEEIVTYDICYNENVQTGGMKAKSVFDGQVLPIVYPEEQLVVKKKEAVKTEVLKPVEAAPEVTTDIIEQDKVVIPEIEQITVVFHGNGGSVTQNEVTCDFNTFSIENIENPERLGKLFTGWYEDAECTIPAGELEEGTTYKEYYAGWSEFPGFFASDNGYITGYQSELLNILDGLLVLPVYDTCVGIKSGSFAGLEDMIFEVYIPANITNLEAGVFDELTNLIYIEVDPMNPAYYSEDGLVYQKDGTLLITPCARK